MGKNREKKGKTETKQKDGLNSRKKKKKKTFPQGNRWGGTPRMNGAKKYRYVVEKSSGKKKTSNSKKKKKTREGALQDEHQ